MPEVRFLKMFRLNKVAAEYVINDITPYLIAGRNTSIPNHLKILCALHFFGHGSYQLDVGNDCHLAMSQPAVSRCVNRVADILCRFFSPAWIQFPTDNAVIQEKVNKFFEKYQFPDILGVIDCTHIAIIAPPMLHDIYPAGPYYNRKGFYSINVQIITDADLNVLNMNARFPGSVHDAAIWSMSNINRHLKNKYLNGSDYHLIGDEGYPLLPWLLVQYPGEIQENTPQGRFNQHLRNARITIERLNGVLKGRFRCLLRHRTLNYNPIVAAKIIYSCGVLHNIAQHFNVPQPEEQQDDVIEIDDFYGDDQFLQQAFRKRDRITETYFNE